MKKCPQCLQEKLASEFQTNGYCKSCMSKYGKVWRQENKERHQEVIRVWVSKNKERVNQLNRELRAGREPVRPNPTKGIPRYNQRGKNNPNWKGGKRSEREVAMGQVEYKRWRASVFKRDIYRCTLCASDKQLEAHHIKPWSENQSLRYEINNGVALCRNCHRRVNRREDEFIERFGRYIKGHPPIPLTSDEIAKYVGQEVLCAQCGKPHYKARWEVKRAKIYFCNIDCKREWEKTHNWGGGRPGKVYKINCAECGKELLRNEYRFKRSSKHFCDRKCKGAFSHNQSLLDNPPLPPVNN